MFRTLHSNCTIYLSTRLPFGDVKPHAVVLKACTVGVGRLPMRRYNIRWSVYVICFIFHRLKCTLICIDDWSFTNICALLFRTLNVSVYILQLSAIVPLKCEICRMHELQPCKHQTNYAAYGQGQFLFICFYFLHLVCKIEASFYVVL